MKKYLLFFIILLFLVFNVNAKVSDIELTNIEILEKNDNVKSDIKSFKNLNTIFFSKDDYVKYKLTIKNNTKNTMKIDEINDNLNSDVINTEYQYEKKELKSNEEYTFILTIKCIKDIDEEKLVINGPLSIIINYDDGKQITIDENPDTMDSIINYFIIFVISAISLVIVITKKGKKQLLGLMLVVSLIPITSNAVSTKKEVTINNNIKVYGKIAKIDNGIVSNKKIKDVAGTDTSTSENAYSVVDTNIVKILRSNSLLDDFVSNESNTISIDESRIPIYIWFDNGILYYYTESEKILLNDNCNRLFQNLTALEEIDLSGFDTSNVTFMGAMFSNCKNLKRLDLSNFDTSNVTVMGGMFQRCENLEEIDLSNFDTSNVNDMSFMFNYCSKLQEIDLSNFDTSNVTTMRAMFQRCLLLEQLDLSSLDTSNVSDMKYMFNNCKMLNSVDLSSFNTSNVNDMQYMFCNCESLTNLDITNFDTSRVTNFDSIFRNCKGLIEIDLSNFSTESATLIRGMFYDCSGLIELDLTNFDTSKVEDMSWLFRGCTNLERVDLSSFNTTSTTDINHMFCYCVKLKSVDMSNFDISKVTSLNGLFYDCESLEEIDLSNFVTNNVNDMTNMFAYCIKLKTIYVGDSFNTSNVTSSSNMFRNNSVLVGGNGTTYNNSYRDKTYARIDTEETPGYFTLKSA